MSDNILVSCRKCHVKLMINPSVFWVTDYSDNDININKELKHIEFLLADEAKKNKCRLNSDQIYIGQVVAVEFDDRLYRGQITDAYYKKSHHSFEILLIDYGYVVEVDKIKIRLITNKELRNKKSCAKKVILQNLQPISLEINDTIFLSNSIFQKRISQNWPLPAFQFIKHLLQFNSVVYVRSFKEDGCTIEGEIYLVAEPKGMPMSLGKLLCDRDFAMFVEGRKFLSNPLVKGTCYSYNDISKKIPQTASSRRLKILNIYQSSFNKGESLTSVSSDSQECSVSSPVKDKDDTLDEDIQLLKNSHPSLPKCDTDFQASTTQKFFSHEVSSCGSSDLFRKSDKKFRLSSLSNCTPENKSEVPNFNFSLKPNRTIDLFALVKRHEEMCNQRQQKDHLFS